MHQRDRPAGELLASLQPVAHRVTVTQGLAETGRTGVDVVAMMQGMHGAWERHGMPGDQGPTARWLWRERSD